MNSSRPAAIAKRGAGRRSGAGGCQCGSETGYIINTVPLHASIVLSLFQFRWSRRRSLHEFVMRRPSIRRPERSVTHFWPHQPEPAACFRRLRSSRSHLSNDHVLEATTKTPYPSTLPAQVTLYSLLFIPFITTLIVTYIFMRSHTVSSTASSVPSLIHRQGRRRQQVFRRKAWLTCLTVAIFGDSFNSLHVPTIFASSSTRQLFHPKPLTGVQAVDRAAAFPPKNRAVFGCLRKRRRHKTTRRSPVVLYTVSSPMFDSPCPEQVTQVGRTEWGRIDKGEGKPEP